MIWKKNTTLLGKVGKRRGQAGRIDVAMHVYKYRVRVHAAAMQCSGLCPNLPDRVHVQFERGPANERRLAMAVNSVV